MISPKLITAPTVSPLSLAEIKDQLLITTSSYDDKLQSFQETARDEFEDQTNRTLHQTTWEYRPDWWPCGPIVLPRAAPLIEVVSVVYVASDGTQTTWSTGEYVVDLPGDRELGRIAPAYGYMYPSFTPYPLSPIRIQYKAGIANASPQVEVSERIKTCLLLMIGALYEHREEYVVADRANAAAIFAANPIVQRMLTNLRASYAC